MNRKRSSYKNRKDQKSSFNVMQLCSSVHLFLRSFSYFIIGLGYYSVKVHIVNNEYFAIDTYNIVCRKVYIKQCKQGGDSNS